MTIKKARQKSMKVKEIFLFGFLLAFFVGCALTHKYGPYYGKVVDGDTKAPIEGAAVLIVYKTQQIGLAGPVAQFADAQETVTDKNGEFKIPAIRINKFRMISGWELHPEVRIFKPGYGCYPMHKYAGPKFDYGSLPEKQYVTIELPQLGSKEERLENYRWGYPSSEVPRIKYKRLLHLINREAVVLGLEPDIEPRGDE